MTPNEDNGYLSECICTGVCLQLVNVKCKAAKKLSIEEAAYKAWDENHPTERIAYIQGAKSQVVKSQHCPYCGNLDWTIEKYGLVLHKQMCPYHQGNTEQLKLQKP